MGAYVNPLAPMGTVRHQWGRFDTYRELGIHWRLWGPMGTYGDLCGPMGTYGDLLGPMGMY